MNDFEDFIEFVNFSRRYRVSGLRRYLRDFSNPFEKYSVGEFHSRFRFTQNAVRNILMPLLAPDLKSDSRRGLPFAPEIMILLTLRFYATGSFQKLDGDVLDVCQQSMSRIICKVSSVIASKMKDFVRFPSSVEEVNRVKQKFYEIANFPGIVGCIDCTHIRIKSPGGLSSKEYRNRNGWFSINIQAVTGPNLKFFDLVAEWPGSYHDNFIFNNSDVKQKVGMGNLQGALLGDNGYAPSTVLLTPFLSPNSEPQERYNRSHIKTRNTVERAFKVWKRKFPCLQIGMNIKVETVVAVICACATLHNIAISHSEIDEDMSGEELSADEPNNVVDIPPVQEDNSGILFRQSLVERFFM